MHQSKILGVRLARSLAIADRASGVEVWDADGKRYLDAVGCAYTVSIGHGVQEIADAMREQASTLAFVNRFHFSNTAAEALAEELLASAPEGFSHAFFVNSGSEAVEAALKLARQYQRDVGQSRRTKIISRKSAYHGLTIGALSAGGLDGFKRAGGWEVWQIPDFIQVETLDCSRCPFSLSHPECKVHCATEIRARIQREGRSSVAAVLVDPAGEWDEPPADYWPEIRRVCDETGALLIADEMVTAFGRLESKFGMTRFGVTPDIIAFGKSVTSGYAPLAGMLVRKHVVEAIRRTSGVFLHGHTFSGNPMACRTALEVQRYSARHNLEARAPHIAQTLKLGLEKIKDEHTGATDSIDPNRRGARVWTGGVGMLRYLRLESPRPGANIFDEQYRAAKILMNKGLLAWVTPNARAVDIKLCPPFVVSDAQLGEMLERLNEVTRAFREGWDAPA